MSLCSRIYGACCCKHGLTGLPDTDKKGEREQSANFPIDVLCASKTRSKLKTLFALLTYLLLMPLANAGAPDGMAWRASMFGTAGSSLMDAPVGRRWRCEKPEMPCRIESEDEEVDEDWAGEAEEGMRWRVSLAGN